MILFSILLAALFLMNADTPWLYTFKKLATEPVV